MSDANTPIGRVAKYVKEEIPEQVAKAIAEIEVPAGEAGADGADGLGFNLKSWENKIHREGSVVQHFIGQAYKALVDTNDEPGDSSDWERVGSNGFRWTGVKSADHEYQDGDLYIDGGTTFMWQGGKGYMFAQRGKNGKDGVDGKAGKDGADASNIIDISIVGKDLVAVFEDGTMHATEMPVLNELGDVKKQLSWLEEQLLEFENIRAPIKGYEGVWENGKSYSKGDLVTFTKGLYLCFEADRNSTSLDPEKWVKIAGGGATGGGGGSSIAPVPSTSKNFVYGYIAGSTNVKGGWQTLDDKYIPVLQSLADLYALRGTSLVAGQPYYVKDQTALYGFIGNPAIPTGTIADWQKLTGASGSIVVNRATDLPQPSTTTLIPNGSLAVVRFHLDGTTPYWRLFSAAVQTDGTVVWNAVQQVIGSKALLGDADQIEATNNDIQVTMENGHKEVKIWDNATGAWIVVYSEDAVKSWIAAGNLFVGTAQDTGHGTAGAIDMANMPTEASLGATDKGHYWTWVGEAGHVVGATEVGGAASSIVGQLLNVGDWIQVGEPTTGNFQYAVIPGDLLAKSRGDSLYGLNPWAAGAYEQGALVVFQGKIYKAANPILLTDPNPTAPTNTKWTVVALSAGVRNVALDANLPATAPAGDVYFVINSGMAGGKPAFYTYDTGASNWVRIGGGHEVPLDLTGGTVIYPDVYSWGGTGTPANGKVVNDLLVCHNTRQIDRWTGTKWERVVNGTMFLEGTAQVYQAVPTPTNTLVCDMSNTIHGSVGVGEFMEFFGVLQPKNHGMIPIASVRFNNSNTDHVWTSSDHVTNAFTVSSFGDGGRNTGFGLNGDFAHKGRHFKLCDTWDGNYKPHTNEGDAGYHYGCMSIRGQLVKLGDDQTFSFSITYQSINKTPMTIHGSYRFRSNTHVTAISFAGIDDQGHKSYGMNGKLAYKWR